MLIRNAMFVVLSAAGLCVRGAAECPLQQGFWGDWGPQHDCVFLYPFSRPQHDCVYCPFSRRLLSCAGSKVQRGSQAGDRASEFSTLTRGMIRLGCRWRGCVRPPPPTWPTTWSASTRGWTAPGPAAACAACWRPDSGPASAQPSYTPARTTPEHVAWPQSCRYSRELSPYASIVPQGQVNELTDLWCNDFCKCSMVHGVSCFIRTYVCRDVWYWTLLRLLTQPDSKKIFDK